MKYILFINELWVKIPQNTIVCYDETSYIFKYENIEFDYYDYYEYDLRNKHIAVFDTLKQAELAKFLL